MNEVKEILDKITDELKGIFMELDAGQIESLEEEIRKANRIFCAGAGRSLLMNRGFAMRLMHMGYTTYVVGETVTPAICEGDLLIIVSGSGRTASLISMVQKAKEEKARVALITTQRESPIALKADAIVCVKTSTTKADDTNGRKSFQPGANAFEQSALLIGDAIVMDLTKDQNLDSNNTFLMKNHANLE